MTDKRNVGLEVEIIEGVLVISIGVETFGSVVQFNDDLTEVYDEKTGEFRSARVTDADLFAEAILYELNAESEDGTTIVHKMFDQAVENAIENGAEGIELP